MSGGDVIDLGRIFAKEASHRAVYGLSPNGGGMVSIADTRSGLNGLLCPDCLTPVIAQKGELRAHHFRHQSKAACQHAGETALHLIIHEMLQHRREIQIPSLLIQGRVIEAPRTVRLSRSEIINVGKGERPMIRIEWIDQRNTPTPRQAILIVSLHFPSDTPRLRQLASTGLPIIEVVLDPSLPPRNMTAFLDALCVSAPRSWLLHPASRSPAAADPKAATAPQGRGMIAPVYARPTGAPARVQPAAQAAAARDVARPPQARDEMLLRPDNQSRPGWPGAKQQSAGAPSIEGRLAAAPDPRLVSMARGYADEIRDAAALFNLDQETAAHAGINSLPDEKRVMELFAPLWEGRNTDEGRSKLLDQDARISSLLSGLRGAAQLLSKLPEGMLLIWLRSVLISNLVTWFTDPSVGKLKQNYSGDAIVAIGSILEDCARLEERFPSHPEYVFLMLRTEVPGEDATLVDMILTGDHLYARDLMDGIMEQDAPMDWVMLGSGWV